MRYLLVMLMSLFSIMPLMSEEVTEPMPDGPTVVYGWMTDLSGVSDGSLGIFVCETKDEVIRRVLEFNQMMVRNNQQVMYLNAAALPENEYMIFLLAVDKNRVPFNVMVGTMEYTDDRIHDLQMVMQILDGFIQHMSEQVPVDMGLKAAVHVLYENELYSGQEIEEELEANHTVTP